MKNLFILTCVFGLFAVVGCQKPVTQPKPCHCCKACKCQKCKCADKKCVVDCKCAK